MNIIFDLGNVVNRWTPAIAVQELFGSQGEAEATLERIGFNAWNLEQDRGRSFEDGFAAVRDPETLRVVKCYHENLDVAHSIPVEGTQTIIRQLHRSGTPLYALTNAARESVASVRAQHDVMSLFRDVVISAEHGVIKPEPEIFEILCQRNRLNREECIFIDDNSTNVHGAKNFGMDAVHFSTPEALADELKQRGLL